MDPIYGHALKLLRARDHTIFELRHKLEKRFGQASDKTIEQLIEKKFLDDRRFAENFVRGRKRQGRGRLRAELERRGVESDIIQSILDNENWPSLGEVVRAKMSDLRLKSPITRRDAARLSRSVQRLGYEAEDIFRELEEFL